MNSKIYENFVMSKFFYSKSETDMKTAIKQVRWLKTSYTNLESAKYFDPICTRFKIEQLKVVSTIFTD